ncbi:MAG: GNAT family N-acetyltransferase [Pirellulaceae bacterium]
MTSPQPSNSPDSAAPCIRNAQRKDVPAILEIIEPYIQRHILIPRNAEDLEKLIPHGFVSEDAGKVVGFVALEIYSSKLAEVQCLAVREDYQQHGLGKQLVEACVERARDEQVFELLAITSSDSFLLSCGFDYSLPDQRRALFLRTGSQRKQGD